MRRHGQRALAVATTLSLLLLLIQPARAADPEIDRLIRGPVGKDWVTNGGNLSNQRYSTLKQIDTTSAPSRGSSSWTAGESSEPDSRV